MNLRATLLVLASLTGGCATQFTQAAEQECTAAGITDKGAYDDCVRAGYQRRQARLESIRTGIARAQAIQNQSTPAVPPTRPARFYQSNYIDGMNRICIYSTINGQEVVTIPSMQLCPLN